MATAHSFDVAGPPSAWALEAATWPHANVSRFIAAGGLTWHVQTLGHGPVALLLHGTGASTHSWRDFAPLLASHYTVVMVDLPGHAFTTSPSAAGLTLPAMARTLAALLRHMQIAPDITIGHSAGAAVALTLAQSGDLAPRRVVGINAALLPFGGLAGLVFQPMARLLTFNPLMANLLAARAKSRTLVAETLAGTGSHLDESDITYYQRLFTKPQHVQSALQMMAGWDLAPLGRTFAHIPVDVTLIVAGGDLAVPPEQGGQVADRLPKSHVVYVPKLGHLAHEEAPDVLFKHVLKAVG
jgi:magnesium chelatase accessory protein